MALLYCESLSFAGRDDWRLPNVRELQSIVDYGRFDPAVDPVFKTQSYIYWSSSIYIDELQYPWSISLWDGRTTFDDTETPRYVRAVRTGP